MKLDTIDYERYKTQLDTYNKNIKNLNMLKNQYNNIIEKNKVILGKMELASDIIIEKYALDKTKMYEISDAGIITEKT